MFGLIKRWLGLHSFPPESLVIPYTDYPSKYVGVAETGDLFFITRPFHNTSNESREFVACYLFHPNGSLKEALITELGTRAELLGKQADILPGNVAADNSTSDAAIEAYLSQLGKVKYQDIRVKPWAVSRFGITFGLVPSIPEFEDDEEDYDDEDDEFYMILEPGNYMAFMPPWDGDFDT